MPVRIVSLALILAAVQALSAAVPQTSAPADLAARISGRWKLNRDLSPTLTEPDPGGRGRRGRGAALAISVAVPQRGGRGGGGAGGGGGIEMPFVTDEEAAAQAALVVIQQVPMELTIAATVTELKIVEPRSELAFRIDGKNVPLEVNGGKIKVKTKWERAGLKQEFSSVQRALVRTWSVDAAGQLVLSQRLQSATFNTKEVRAVFERQ